MADTFARVGDAVTGLAVTGTSDMPDFSGDHFTWEGSCWEAVTDPGLLVATMDPAASPAAKEALTARIVQAMSVATKKLVVTEEAILNHATLIGQTVVDDINVQGKLIGTDGVFTGTVDFENINVTDEVLASRISGEHIYGTVIEGGEIRTGTDESRGAFLLGDRAYVHPGDGYETPGIRFDPPNSTLLHPPGVGVIGGSVELSGGRAADGRYSRLRASVSGVAAVSSPAVGDPVGWGSLLDITHGSLRLSSGPQASTNGAEVSVKAPVFINGEEVGRPHVRLRIARNGQSAKIEASNGTTTIESSDGTTTRSLKMDSSGVWATEGSNQVSLIPQVRPFQYSALWNADQSPAPIMVQHLPGGKLCQAQIRIQNLSGSPLSLPNATWVTLNYNPIPSDLRGGFTDYIEVTLPQNEARGRVEMNYSTGSIRIRNISGTNISWEPNNSIWFPMRWFSPN